MKKNVVFAIIFICIGVGVTILGSRVLKKSKASTGWPTVEGTVTSAETRIARHPAGDRARSSTKAVVVYSYSVEGIKYSSDRISFVQDGAGSGHEAHQIVRRYPFGKKVKVYFNPDDPRVSVLEPGMSLSSFMPLGAGVVFIIVGVVTFFVGLVKKNVKQT